MELAETTALQALQGLLMGLCHALAVVFPQPQPACRAQGGSETLTQAPQHSPMLSAHFPPGPVSCCHRGARPGAPGQLLCAHVQPLGSAHAQWAQPMPSGLCQLTLLAPGLAADREAGSQRCRDLKHLHQCSVLINYPLTFTFISQSSAVTQQGQSLPPWPHRCLP